MRVWNGEPDESMAHAMVIACKFLSKQEAASLQLHFADSVFNDCFSCLFDAAVGLSRAAIPAAIADLLCIFASRHFSSSMLSVQSSPCRHSCCNIPPPAATALFVRMCSACFIGTSISGAHLSLGTRWRFCWRLFQHSLPSSGCCSCTQFKAKAKRWRIQTRRRRHAPKSSVMTQAIN